MISTTLGRRRTPHRHLHHWRLLVAPPFLRIEQKALVLAPGPVEQQDAGQKVVVPEKTQLVLVERHQAVVVGLEQAC
jgi:hypothetical protein